MKNSSARAPGGEPRQAIPAANAGIATKHTVPNRFVMAPSTKPPLPRYPRAGNRAARPLALALAIVAITARQGKATDDGDLAGRPPMAPNVLLLMADDLGWGDVGFNGNTVIQTPHLDRFAADGLVFERFYSASAVCSPTRGSCLTGRHPQRYGIFNANSGHLPEDEITLPELLAARGYRCGHFGKWHLGTLTMTEEDANRGGPKNAAHFSPPRLHGFVESFSTESKVPTFDPMIRPREARRTWWDAVVDRDAAVPYGTAYWRHDGARATDGLDGDDSAVLMDRALRFIESTVAGGAPCFATIWFHAPHLPVVASDADRDAYAAAGLDPYGRHYAGCITALDRQVGRLRATLERLGIARDTLVFFCSDNGPEGTAASAPGSAAPFRGRKRDLYEGGIRVPAFAWWPARIEGGRRTAFPAVTSDYLPTLCDLLDLDPPADRPIDGTSLVPILDAPDSRRARGESPPRRDAPIHFHFGRRLASAGDRWKLVTTDDGKSWQLYDLVADPAESRDVAGDHPELVAERRRGLLAWRQSCDRDREGAAEPEAR